MNDNIIKSIWNIRFRTESNRTFYTWWFNILYSIHWKHLLVLKHYQTDLIQIIALLKNLYFNCIEFIFICLIYVYIQSVPFKKILVQITWLSSASFFVSSIYERLYILHSFKSVTFFRYIWFILFIDFVFFFYHKLKQTKGNTK